jgi:hypothetical protein
MKISWRKPNYKSVADTMWTTLGLNLALPDEKSYTTVYKPKGYRNRAVNFLRLWQLENCAD